MRVRKTICDICGDDIKTPGNKMAYVLKRKNFGQFRDEFTDRVDRVDVCEQCMSAITAGILTAVMEERTDAGTGEGR